MALATNVLSFQPATTIRASATSGDQTSRKTTSTSSPNWWTPIFGWPSDPDYINSSSTSTTNGLTLANEKPQSRSESDPVTRPRFNPGCFTEEKARQLRIMNMELESFHDGMYHSAVASRLVSDIKIKNRSKSRSL
ncbi:hypothetical protein RJ641_026162 [Dillenia turbinata]|uniref:Uncharacterized protein n=1 Tax=Dillenia turbinata TaxID=194707 RepID=A0AAN8ZTV2_9MAGN